MSRTAQTVLVSLLSFFLFSAAAWADDREAARSAALEWLSYIDAGEYERSWEEAAELLKSELTADVWRTAATNVRSPHGDLVNRSFHSARQTTTIPGFPRGDYVVVVFSSRFSGRRNAEETVTMMNEDGEWRAVGYFIS